MGPFEGWETQDLFSKQLNFIYRFIECLLYHIYCLITLHMFYTMFNSKKFKKPSHFLHRCPCLQTFSNRRYQQRTHYGASSELTTIVNNVNQLWLLFLLEVLLTRKTIIYRNKLCVVTLKLLIFVIVIRKDKQM